MARSLAPIRRSLSGSNSSGLVPEGGSELVGADSEPLGPVAVTAEELIGVWKSCLNRPVVYNSGVVLLSLCFSIVVDVIKF